MSDHSQPLSFTTQQAPTTTFKPPPNHFAPSLRKSQSIRQSCNSCTFRRPNTQLTFHKLDPSSSPVLLRCGSRAPTERRDLKSTFRTIWGAESRSVGDGGDRGAMRQFLCVWCDGSCGMERARQRGCGSLCVGRRCMRMDLGGKGVREYLWQEGRSGGTVW